MRQYVHDAIRTVLAANPGRLMTAHEIADAVWASNPDGGPSNADVCIRVAIWRMRKNGDTKIEHVEGYRLA